MSLPKPALLSSFALLAASITGTLCAQTNPADTHAANIAPGSQARPPTIHVYSRETIVDVLVTDDKGQPVRGLTRNDFTIEEDGKPQPIRGFSEFDKNTPPPPARALPPNTFTNDNKLPANGPVQIFLFDLGSPPDQMQRAKKYIADYLRSMPAGTEVAIFELSPSKGLVLLQGFTSDGHAAAAAVDNLDVEWIRNPAPYTPIAVAGMNQIAAYVAGIKGRKNLIWIVPGMPLMITRDGGYAGKFAPPDMTYVHRLMDLYDTFIREQIAIYPLDPDGVHALGPGALMAMEVADATGGATDNTNDYKSEAAKFVDSTSHMYTLSYIPPRPDEDGHYHTITIKLNRPGLHLNYRPGYNDEQPQPPDKVLKQQMVQGPMRLGAIPATQLVFYFNIEAPTGKSLARLVSSNPPQPHTKGAPYATTFTIDPTQLSLLQQPNGTRTVSIEIDLGAFDFYGKLVTSRSQTFDITVKPNQLANFYRRPIAFPLAIDLPPGQLTLRAGIFDTIASKAGTLQTPITVPKKK